MRSLTEVLKDWEAVIGLEVHTELTTLETKMFCGCRLSHGDEPNQDVCPVCLGMPGALPVPNKDAIRSIVKAGLATNCEIMERSMFYRKHYFYPDMAKNFQTTQGPVAFCMHGHLDLEVTGEGAAERPRDSKNVTWTGDAYETDIRILRIHMEEDAAKMVHVGGEEGRIASATESLIDYNRCGTPLIELVTEPDLRTPEEARLFMEKLRRIFLTLGISDCSMENGSMRCDGNVSLRKRGSKELGTKTELKNINSFKSLHDALEYEIRRQADVLEAGGTVAQETRHWEPSKKRTVVMRVKETADDYRLFPDPDLAPFDLSRAFVDDCRAEMPELPDAKRDRYVKNLGIKRADAALIASDPATAEYFEKAVDAAATEAGPKAAATIANLVVNELAALVKNFDGGFAESPVSAAHLATLASMLAKGEVSSTAGREVLAAVAETGKAPEAIVEERGLRQVTDDGALAPIVAEVMAACPDQVRQFRDGNAKVVGFLVGQCMKRAKGQGNPKRFNELLVEAMSAEPAEAKKPAEPKTEPKATEVKTEPKTTEATAPAPAKKAPAKKSTAKKPAAKAAPAKVEDAKTAADVKAANADKAAAETVEAPAKESTPESAKKPAARKPAAKPAAKKATTRAAASKKTVEKATSTAVKTQKAQAQVASAAAEVKAAKDVEPSGEATEASVKTPAKKTATRKAPAKKANAVEDTKATAGAKKTAAPAKKATATKTAARKAPAKKTSASKSAGAKTSTAKATAEKATAESAAADEPKHTPAPAKKADATKTAPKTTTTARKRS